MENVKAEGLLADEWQNLFDKNLRRIVADEMAILDKIYEAFMSTQMFVHANETRKKAMYDLVHESKLLYNANAYHSFLHAAHVVLSAKQLQNSLLIKLTSLDEFALLYASLIHDIAHEGVFNSTLIAEEHETSILYNDVSCAEMKSLNLGLANLKRFHSDLGLSTLEFQYLRKIIIELVMNTDLGDPWRYKLFKIKVAEAIGSGPADMTTDAGKLVCLVVVLKLSDVSSLLQSFETVLEWAYRFFTEQSHAHLMGRGPPVTVESFDASQVSFMNSYCLDLIGILERTQMSPLTPVLRTNVMHSVEQWKLQGTALVINWYSSFHHDMVTTDKRRNVDTTNIYS
jgi:hypothetical protein